MKSKICMLLLMFILLKINAAETVLIDFNNLKDTTIDFSANAGVTITEDEKKAMQVDLSPKNWIAMINSSSRTYLGRVKTKSVQVTKSVEYPDQTLLGIRVYFPDSGANSYATITPPYEIPSYYDNKNNPDGMGSMFLSKGIVRNIGVLKKIHIRVLGNNYKYSLHLLLKMKTGEPKIIFMGYLNFIGWQTLSWVNSNYDFDSFKRSEEKDSRPYYPDEYQYVKLEGFIIHRIDPNTSGNFVTMIKDIVIEYDPQFPDIGNETVDKQENIFHIYQEELIDRAKSAMWNVNQRLLNEFLESRKMDVIKIR
jgi:hypothetical protein